MSFFFMSKRFYVDTCIWRDLLEDRSDGLRPLGEFAFQFLINCRKHSCKVLCSEFVIKELEKEFTRAEIDTLFEPFLDLIIFVSFNRKQLDESFSIKTSAHQADILHAIIARDNECVLITRDKHFSFLSDLVKVLSPEEVVFD